MVSEVGRAGERASVCAVTELTCTYADIWPPRLEHGPAALFPCNG